MPPDDIAPPEFPSTGWTLIRQARTDQTPVRGVALRELVARYVPPLRAHLVLRRRLDTHVAADVLQSFVTEKILERYLLSRADPLKGRFRALLVRSLDNYCVDWLRAHAARPLTGHAQQLEATADDAPAQSEIFEAAWAHQLLAETLAVMQADCNAGRQHQVWGVFEYRLLAPVREQCEPLSYEEVCARFGFASPEQASNALITAKRKFQRAFDEVAARYRHDDEQTADVLHELINVLSRVGPLEWRQAPVAGAVGALADSASVLHDSRPARVARLLGLAPEADALWPAEDLAGLMRHQLAQRLVDLDANGTHGIALATQHQPGTHALVTLEDLFRHPAPPLELLQAVKRYGRRQVQSPGTSFPGEVASALYFGTIAAARVRHGQRISKSDDELLAWGFHRLLERPWIDSPLRELLEKGVVLVTATRPYVPRRRDPARRRDSASAGASTA